MKVVPYEPKYKNIFVAMNKAWIEEMFVLEPEDVELLNNIEKIIAKGAEIFFTLDDDGEVLACCMLEPHDTGDWEIAKFASSGKVKGAGTLCFEACMESARRKGLKKILIVSNTKCAAGIHIYKKAGFREIPVDKKLFHYDRANIAFEKYL